MPKNIFGENIVFRCETCKIDFTRKEYLSIHLTSEKHLKNVEPGTLPPKKRNTKNDEVKNESELWFKMSKNSDIEIIDPSEIFNNEKSKDKIDNILKETGLLDSYRNNESDFTDNEQSIDSTFIFEKEEDRYVFVKNQKKTSKACEHSAKHMLRSG
jgi:hypothetical protein